MDSDAIAAVVVPIAIFGFPVAAWIVHRVFKHQEYMAMIRHGMTPPIRGQRPPRGPGWGPPPGPPPPEEVESSYAYYNYDWAAYMAQRQLHRGITVLFVGAALFIGLSFIGFGARPGTFIPGPWLLGGLIPMFVGAAQVVSAILSGARFGSRPTPPPGAWQQQGRPQTPFGSPPPPPPPQPPPQGPVGWRPGGYPEIERPVNPPDNRK